MTTSANVTEYRISKDGKVVGKHRQHCLCKTHWNKLCEFIPMDEHTIIAYGLDENEAPWEAPEQGLIPFLKSFPESCGWSLIERDGFLHWETPKGQLSQGFSSEAEAILAYHYKLILWKYVRRGQLSNIRMAAGNEKRYSMVIVDGILKGWFGIGWIGDDAATIEDKEKYLTAID